MVQTVKYKTDPTRKTPWIVLEPGKIFIMGRSIPENSGEFYRPVIDWIKKYILSDHGKTKIELGFEYINTSSIKWIYSLLKELSEMEDLAEKAFVTWYYECGDDDMSELGVILRSLIICPFTIVEVEGMNRKRYEEILNGLAGSSG